MSRPTLVRTLVREEFEDMAGATHPTYAAAHRASVLSLVSVALVDLLGERTCDTDDVAAALLEQFVIVPRTDR